MAMSPEQAANTPMDASVELLEEAAAVLEADAAAHPGWAGAVSRGMAYHIRQRLARRLAPPPPVDPATAARLEEIEAELRVMDYSDAPTNWTRRGDLTAERARLARNL